MKPLSPQEKKDYLMRYGDYKREMLRLGAELAAWRSCAEGMDRPGEIVRLEAELGCRLADLASMRRGIERAIRSVGEERLQLLLCYRYVDGMTMQRIAETMHYSERQVANLHRRAIDRVMIRK